MPPRRHWLALAVALLVVFVASLLFGSSEGPGDVSKVTLCEQNLLEIQKALLLYEKKHGHLPEESGARFLAALTEFAQPRSLTCPGIDIGSLALGEIEQESNWFLPLDRVDGNRSSYAARDNVRFPIAHFPGPKDEILVADDNDGGKNHRTCTVVLWADGSVGTLDYRDPAIAPLLDKEGKLVVGPDSPLEALRKLSLD